MGGTWSNLTNTGGVILQGSSHAYWSGVLQNNGTMVLNKPSYDLRATANNAQIVNTGTFEHQAGRLYSGYSGVQLVNQGTIRKTTNSSVTWQGIQFTQTDGALLIEGGTLNADQTLNLQGGRLGGHNATLSPSSPATLNNTGATIDLGTQSQPVGILTLNGNWTQGANAKMRVHLAGTDNSDINAPQYDQLRVVGASGRQITLDGELQVASANGYTPNVGDTYDIIVRTSGSWTRTGTFSRVRGIGLVGCYTFTVEYLADRVRLHVTGTGDTSGDANGDGCVDDADLLMVLFAFGQEGSDLVEDRTCDGVVDDADLLIVLFEFGSGC